MSYEFIAVDCNGELHGAHTEVLLEASIAAVEFLATQTIDLTDSSKVDA